VTSDASSEIRIDISKVLDRFVKGRHSKKKTLYDDRCSVDEANYVTETRQSKHAIGTASFVFELRQFTDLQIHVHDTLRLEALDPYTLRLEASVQTTSRNATHSQRRTARTCCALLAASAQGSSLYASHRQRYRRHGCCYCALASDVTLMRHDVSPLLSSR